MKRILLYLILLVTTSNLWGQEDYVLETRFRNPIDTAKFHDSPTLLLFVHSKCQHGHLCPTTRMQKALEMDSLGFRMKYGIKLYVIYPEYSLNDIQTFDSFAPTKNATIAFYTKHSYKGTFHEGNDTPHVVFFDGKGHIRTKTGGSVNELKDSICGQWRYSNKRCPICNGTGRVKPNRLSHDPDLSVGICRKCSGGIIGKEQLY